MSGRTRVVKVVLLGDGGVGKSSLMNRFVSDKFDAQSFHTIGVEFLNRDVTLDGDTYTLQIWDTAGQERFKSLRTPFYRGADCCLLTFALDDQQSIANLSMWKKEFLLYADIQEDESFPFVVLGNKCDVEKKTVSKEEAHEWCHVNGNAPYFEVSAKDATNVDLAFMAAVKRIRQLEEQSEKDRTRARHSVDLRKSQGKSSCC